MSEPAASGTRVTWADLERHWDLLEADLHERFAIDLWAPGVLDRPWPWLAARISALLATPPTSVLVATKRGFGSRQIPTTRIQQALTPDTD